jgi:hypothetical protein
MGPGTLGSDIGRWRAGLSMVGDSLSFGAFDHLLRDAVRGQRSLLWIALAFGLALLAVGVWGGSWFIGTVGAVLTAFAVGAFIRRIVLVWRDHRRRA